MTNQLYTYMCVYIYVKELKHKIETMKTKCIQVIEYECSNCI